MQSIAEKLPRVRFLFVGYIKGNAYQDNLN